MGKLFEDYRNKYEKAMEDVLLENMIPEDVWIAKAYSQENDLRPCQEDFADRVMLLCQEDPDLCASVIGGIRMLIDEAYAFVESEDQRRLFESIYGMDEDEE